MNAFLTLGLHIHRSMPDATFRNLNNFSSVVISYRKLSKLIRTDQFGAYKVLDPPRPRGLLLLISFSKLLYRDSKSLNKIISRKQFKSSYLRFENISNVVKYLTTFSLFKAAIFTNMNDHASITDANSPNSFSPPEDVRGMKNLNRDKFIQNVKVFGIKVPAGFVAVVSRRFKDSLLKIPKIKPIAELCDSDSLKDSHKLLLFNPTKLPSAESFRDTDKEFVAGHDVDITNTELYDLSLTYENWTYDQILSAILPENSDGVGGFSIIGHIAHLNLRQNLLEYKEIIGWYIL